MDLLAQRVMKPQNELVEQDGKLHDVTSVEVDGVFEGAQALMDLQDDAGGSSSKRYLGSIDFVTARIWAKECGAKLFSKEWRAYAKKKIQSGDYALYFPKAKRKRYV